MPWLDHGIHSVTSDKRCDSRIVAIRDRNGMDCRVKPGNDDKTEMVSRKTLPGFPAAAL